MRTVGIVLALVIAVNLSAAGSAQEKKANKDSDAIQGTWVESAAETGGKQRENVGNMRLILKDGKYEIFFGKNSGRGTVKLDPSAKPKALDLTNTEGPSKGKTVLAIYELDGDTLRICYDKSGKDRPTEFKTTAGTGLVLVTCQRKREQSDSDAIQGFWMATEASTGGKRSVLVNIGIIGLVVKDGKYDIPSFGAISGRGTIKLDPSAKPKALDIICTEGPNKGKTFLAIYELHGDTLRICYDLSGKNRPTEFTIVAQIYLLTHERKKR